MTHFGILKWKYKEMSFVSFNSTRMTMTSTMMTSYSVERMDFLTYLRNKFKDQENSMFLTSFAGYLHEKNEEFCIDLDDNLQWLGYARKDKALELLHKLELKENGDYILPRSEEIKKKGRKLDRYHLKPVAFKKMLLAARTEEAKKAAEYFIKIEEAIFEFAEAGGTFGDVCPPEPERRIPFKNLPLENFTRVYDPEKNPIVSAGYHDKMQDPQVYFGIVKNMRFVADAVPDGCSILSFGYTGSADNRLRDHQSKNGDYIYIDHLPCAASYELEQQIRRFLIVMGRLLVGRRLNDSKDYEVFWVYDQADYIDLISQFWEKRQQMMDSICKEYGRSTDIMLAKETTKQAEEKTKQIIAQAELEVRKAEAEATKLAEMEAHRTRQLQVQGELELAKEKEKTIQVLAECEARKMEAAARKAEAESVRRHRDNCEPLIDHDQEVEGEIDQDSEAVSEIEEAPAGNEEDAEDSDDDQPVQLLNGVDQWLIQSVKNDTLPSVIFPSKLGEILSSNSHSVSYYMNKYIGHGVERPKKRITVPHGTYAGRGFPFLFKKKALTRYLTSLRLL